MLAHRVYQRTDKSARRGRWGHLASDGRGTSLVDVGKGHLRKMISEQSFCKLMAAEPTLTLVTRTSNGVVGVVEGGDGLLLFLEPMPGTNAPHVKAEDQHEHIGQPRGRRPIAEDDRLASLHGADLGGELGGVAELDRLAASDNRPRMVLVLRIMANSPMD